MPFSQPTTPDALVKKLHIALGAAATYQQLGRLGWFDFLKFDRPDTTNPIEMAREAVHCLRTDDDGKWHGNTAIVSAVFAFTFSLCGSSPTDQQFAELLSILKTSVRDRNPIDAWFAKVFPPNQ